MSARWRLILALPALICLKVARAQAAAPMALTYDAAPGCPGYDTISADVAAQIRDVSHAAGRNFELTIVAAGSGFSGELVATDAMGERTRRHVEGQTCAEVAHALAFLTAVAVGLEGRLEDPGQASTPTPPSPRRAKTPFFPPMTTRRPWNVALMALGEVRGGLAPVPLLSAAVGLDVERQLSRTFAPSMLLVVDEAAGHLAGAAGTAELWMVGGRVALCPLRFGGSSLGLRPCADAEVGAVHAQGHTSMNPRAVTEPWASVGAILRARWLVAQHFFIDAELAAELQLVRTRYFFEPEDTLYVTPPATGRGGFGLGLLL